jgi:hypothetical protein
MKSSKRCNDCSNRNCGVFTKDDTGRYRHPKLVKQAIRAEKSGTLTCFVPQKRKVWKLPDLVSKVTINNPDNPAIQLLSFY